MRQVLRECVLQALQRHWTNVSETQVELEDLSAMTEAYTVLVERWKVLLIEVGHDELAEVLQGLVDREGSTFFAPPEVLASVADTDAADETSTKAAPKKKKSTKKKSLTNVARLRQLGSVSMEAPDPTAVLAEFQATCIDNNEWHGPWSLIEQAVEAIPSRLHSRVPNEASVPESNDPEATEPPAKRARVVKTTTEPRETETPPPPDLPRPASDIGDSRWTSIDLPEAVKAELNQRIEPSELLQHPITLIGASQPLGRFEGWRQRADSMRAVRRAFRDRLRDHALPSTFDIYQARRPHVNMTVDKQQRDWMDLDISDAWLEWAPSPGEPRKLYSLSNVEITILVDDDGEAFDTDEARAGTKHQPKDETDVI